MSISPLYFGRPEDERIPKEMRCYDCLDELGIGYHRMDHHVTSSIEMCKEVEAILGCEVCKNLLLTNRQMTDVYLLVMPGDKPFKTRILSKQIGTSRLSFATAEQMEQLLDITPGSLTVLGVMNDKANAVRVLIDRDILLREYIGCHPCINTSSLRIATPDVLERFLPAMHHEFTVVDLPWNPDEV